MDRRILLLLHANARMTYQELGDGVGLSAPAVFQRVKRLEEAGLITGYHAHLSPSALGGSITAVVRALPGPTSDRERLEEAWAATAEVVECQRTVSGEYWLKLHLPSLRALEPHVQTARTAGCAVRAEVISETVFQRWVVPVPPAQRS